MTDNILSPDDDPRVNDKPSVFRSSWQNPLPVDEIGRQQDMKSRLTPGLCVELRGLGLFIYSGVWDTMHVFYPAEQQDLPKLISNDRRRYLKHDIRGRWFIQLPYTQLADHILLISDDTQ